MKKPDLSSEKIQAEIAKLIAETSRINHQNRSYRILIPAAMLLAGIAVGTILI